MKGKMLYFLLVALIAMGALLPNFALSKDDGLFGMITGLYSFVIRPIYTQEQDCNDNNLCTRDLSIFGKCINVQKCSSSSVCDPSTGACLPRLAIVPNVPTVDPKIEPQGDFQVQGTEVEPSSGEVCFTVYYDFRMTECPNDGNCDGNWVYYVQRIGDCAYHADLFGFNKVYHKILDKSIEYPDTCDSNNEYKVVQYHRSDNPLVQNSISISCSNGKKCEVGKGICVDSVSLPPPIFDNENCVVYFDSSGNRCEDDCSGNYRYYGVYTDVKSDCTRDENIKGEAQVYNAEGELLFSKSDTCQSYEEAGLIQFMFGDSYTLFEYDLIKNTDTKTCRDAKMMTVSSVPSERCSDGTQVGECSSATGFECKLDENGVPSYIPNCQKCGCLQTLTCDTYDQFCKSCIGPSTPSDVKETVISNKKEFSVLLQDEYVDTCDDGKVVKYYCDGFTVKKEVKDCDGEKTCQNGVCISENPNQCSEDDKGKDIFEFSTTSGIVEGTSNFGSLSDRCFRGSVFERYCEDNLVKTEYIKCPSSICEDGACKPVGNIQEVEQGDCDSSLPCCDSNSKFIPFLGKPDSGNHVCKYCDGEGNLKNQQYGVDLFGDCNTRCDGLGSCISQDLTNGDCDCDADDGENIEDNCKDGFEPKINSVLFPLENGQNYYYCTCIPKTGKTCKDTDRGNKFTRGTTTTYFDGEVTSSYTDECTKYGNNHFVHEGYCLNGNSLKQYIYCGVGYICEDGACKRQCEDSDRDNDIYTKGTVKGFLSSVDSGVVTRSDYCSGEYVIQHFCNDNSLIESEPYRCVNGCVDGACVTEQQDDVTCVDSDTGNKPYLKGTITGLNYNKERKTLIDSCSDNSLTEYYCSNNRITYTTVNCAALGSGYICADGACILLDNTICEPGEYKCDGGSGNDLYVCNDEGDMYQLSRHCSSGCCDGKCVDLQTDEKNCGKCGIECDDSNPCTFDTCSYGACKSTPKCSLGETCDEETGECFELGSKDTCTDSDGGYNPYEKGTFRIVGTNEDGVVEVLQSLTDQCESRTVLREYRCYYHDLGDKFYTEYVNCAALGSGYICANGECARSCLARSEACEGACGTVDNGCDGTYDCGDCQTGYKCTNNVCVREQAEPSPTVTPTPECNEKADCLKKNPTKPNSICLGGKCKCYPDTFDLACIESGVQCGIVNDGCGGTHVCGYCSEDEECVDGQCVDKVIGECTTACQGRECGRFESNEGYLCQCGTCDVTKECNQYGKCVEKSQEETVKDGCKSDNECSAGERCVARYDPFTGETTGYCELITCNAHCSSTWQCGDDGCGGSCGTCDAGEKCVGHKCFTEYCGDFGSVSEAATNACKKQYSTGIFAYNGACGDKAQYFVSESDPTKISLNCLEKTLQWFVCKEVYSKPDKPIADCVTECSSMNSNPVTGEVINCDSECVRAKDCRTDLATEFEGHQIGCIYYNEGGSCETAQGTAGKCQKGVCIPS